MEKDYLTESELSKKLHISLGTLRRWRLENRGPKFRKLGALVRYGEYDLDQWMLVQPSGGATEIEKLPPAIDRLRDAHIRRAG
jgi:hypothetical protein